MGIVDRLDEVSRHRDDEFGFLPQKVSAAEQGAQKSRATSWIIGFLLVAFALGTYGLMSRDKMIADTKTAMKAPSEPIKTAPKKAGPEKKIEPAETVAAPPPVEKHTTPRKLEKPEVKKPEPEKPAAPVKDEAGSVVDRLIAKGAVQISRPDAAPKTRVAGTAPTPPEKAATETGAVETPPAPQEKKSPPTLENLFHHPDIKGGLEAAVTKLFALWNRKPSALGGLNPCAEAKAQGLICLQRKSALEGIKIINLPALISLADRGGGHRYAVVTATQDSKVILDVDGHQIAAGAEKLEPLWTGEFVVLWEPPADVRATLFNGMTGHDVAWLRGRLAEAMGIHADLENAGLFDGKLAERVRAFQKSRGIKSDGIAGILTQIHLSMAVKGSTVPVLDGRQ